MREYPEAAVERAMKVHEVILRAMAKRITWWQAAEILGISDRAMRRWRRRMEEDGFRGVFDRRIGHESAKRVPVETIDKVLSLYRDKYFDFNVKHFHEKLTTDHGIELSYTWIKRTLQAAGLAKKAPRRGCHRRRRPRRPLPGMLLHLDGSHHQWFQDDRWYDLIVVMDDATSEIYYAQLVDDESTTTVMAALKQVVEDQGWFCALYSDRASHFFVTSKAGEQVDRRQLTQVGRALRDLDIQMIPAYSPQARGRSERNFKTWQGRLPQELRSHGIATVEAANQFLRNHYIAEFNTKFKVAAAEPGTAFVPNLRLDLDRVFSIQHERVVNNDNTISFGHSVLQLERVAWRATLAGCRVIVYEHLDGSVSIGYGPHELARFPSIVARPKPKPREAVKRSQREKKESAMQGGGRFFLNKVTSAARSAPR
jgi:transposase